MNGDRLDAFAMMFRAGADLPGTPPAVMFPDWATELMGRSRRWGRTKAALDAAAAAMTRADRLAALARALNVPPAALEVDAANHYTALLPRPAQEWQDRAFEHFEDVRRQAGAEVLERFARVCYRVPCAPWPDEL